MYIPVTVPSWRSGHAAACRAALLPFKSGTWLRGFCGHSREVPPGPIPNPAVKLPHVHHCTQIREFSGTGDRCTPFLLIVFCIVSLFCLFGLYCLLFCCSCRSRASAFTAYAFFRFALVFLLGAYCFAGQDYFCPNRCMYISV